MRPSRSAVLLFGPLGQRLADSIIPSPNTFHDVDNYFKRSDYTIPCPFDCSVENLTLGAASTGVWGRSSCAIYLHLHQTKSCENLSQDLTSSGSSLFGLDSESRECDAALDFWKVWRAHTMAESRCYTCSRIHRSLEALACWLHWKIRYVYN